MLNSSRSRATAVAALALGLSPVPVQAAGFALFEQGARGMGFAGAFTAQASDASAIFHNPAGLAFLRRRQVYVGGTIIAPSSTFHGADPFPGTTITEKTDVGVLVPPTAYYAHPFTERVAFGVGLHVPFGLKSRWANPGSYSGRFISQRAELSGFAFNPTVAYKLADRLAVGAGLDVRFSSVTLERGVPLVNPFTQRVIDAAVARLDSDTATGIGFNLGLLGKLSDSLSVGLSYRHKVKVDYEGSAVFDPVSTGNAQLDERVAAQLPRGPLPISTSIEFPGFASVGVAWNTGRWTVEADVNWYQWSTFSRLRIDFEAEGLDEVIVEDYEDSFQYRVGVERTIGEAWAARGGYFFDRSPSPAASVSPILPDADRHGFALGGSWTSGRLRVDGGAWFVISPSRSTQGLNHDRYDGAYESRAITFGLSVGYLF